MSGEPAEETYGSRILPALDASRLASESERDQDQRERRSDQEESDKLRSEDGQMTWAHQHSVPAAIQRLIGRALTSMSEQNFLTIETTLPLGAAPSPWAWSRARSRRDALICDQNRIETTGARHAGMMITNI